LKYIFLAVVLLSGCVGPPDYADGLIENKPAIVNDTDYFSLSLLGDKYDASDDWNLLMDLTEDDRILVTTVVKDVVASSDSTYLYMINDQSDTVFTAGIFSDLISGNEIDVIELGLPKKVVLICNSFTGRIEFQLIKIQ
tara:strand:+ start:704 stop:1120 length:417 start_codon:yes stop_codon:yes gene_type:complete